jgi:plastocyanin
MRTTRALVAAVIVAATFSPVPARAVAPAEVDIRDNFFDPREIRIEPGEAVTWTDRGFRPHTVTSDTGLFDSGAINAGDFSFTFEEKGTYYYHCRLHGAARRGMWGVVIVGTPPKDERPKLTVPGDYSTIQGAVDAAKPGTSIVVSPGTYREEVVVETPRVTIRGVDRFRTRLNGGRSLGTGIQVAGAAGVKVKNLTVRDYAEAGIGLVGAEDFTISKVDAIKNRTFGVVTTGTRAGTIAQSFGWGSGEAAFRVGSCFGCGILLDDLRAETNAIGIEAVNATGVTIRSSLVRNNGVGILARSDSSMDGSPTQGVFVVDNRVTANNNETIPPAGLTLTFGLPFGTGIWFAGANNGVATRNEVTDNSSYGVLVTDDLTGESSPVGNRVQNNGVRSPEALDLAWDGSGGSDCFGGNSFRTSGPADIEAIYPCSARPFDGQPYLPVMQDVDEAIAAGPPDATAEPPEPDRPKCQRGKPGCRR